MPFLLFFFFQLLQGFEFHETRHFHLLGKSTSFVFPIHTFYHIYFELRRVELDDIVDSWVDGLWLSYNALANFLHPHHFLDDDSVSIRELTLESLLQCHYAFAIFFIYFYLLYHDFLELLSIFIQDHEGFLLFDGGRQASKIIEDFSKQPILSHLNEGSCLFSTHFVYLDELFFVCFQDVKGMDDYFQITVLDILLDVSSLL